MTAETFISPTVRHRYDENPDWVKDQNITYRRGFVSRKSEFDHEGYDLAGFGEHGLDRAGFSREEYEADPILVTVVHAVGEAILAGKRTNRTFGQLLATTDIIVEELQAAYPDVSFCDAHLAQEAGSHVVVRDMVAGGNLSVAYRENGNYVAFTTDEVAETFGDHPTGHGLMVYTRDPIGRYETRLFAEDEAELRNLVREVLSYFRPHLRKYAVFIVDSPDGPAFETCVYRHYAEEDGDVAAPELEGGDYVADVIAESAEEALTEFAASRRNTLAVAEMVERGIARLHGIDAAGTEYAR